MKKVDDIFLLGCIGGLAGAIPGRILNAIEYKFGLTKMTYASRAVSLFSQGSRVKKPTTADYLLGSTINNVISSFAGTSLAYALSKTGKEYAALKGVGVAMFYWLLLTGLSAKIGLVSRSNETKEDLLAIIDHILGGVIAGTVISNLGDNSIFPAKKRYNSSTRAPIVRYKGSLAFRR